MKNYGIYCSNEPYYGRDAAWAEYVSADDDYVFENHEPSREQIIEFINKRIDYLSKFIKPSALLDFSKALSDTHVGEELYSNLCENLAYIDELQNKAYETSSAIGEQYADAVFGKNIPYNTEDDLHLMPFPSYGIGDGEKLASLLKEHGEFKKWFASMMTTVNKDVYLILFGVVNRDEIIMADVSAHIKVHLKSISECEERIKAHKTFIKGQLNRLSGSIILDDETKKLVEKAKRVLEENE